MYNYLFFGALLLIYLTAMFAGHTQAVDLRDHFRPTLQEMIRKKKLPLPAPHTPTEEEIDMGRILREINERGGLATIACNIDLTKCILTNQEE